MNGHSERIDGVGLGLVAPPSSTRIKVVIVGSGFAGLAYAIECKRKGHDVLVLEKFPELRVLGELAHLDCWIIADGELIFRRCASNVPSICFSTDFDSRLLA
jgi:cation diffusion facilitator CzcD-associated flavoprotein CzcO